MRAPSIPTWTTLAGDPTESSAAPSEDELQSLASQEMDEIASSPPPRQAIPTQKKQANMGPPTSRVTATNSNMQGSGTGVKHTSTANARRLLSGSDEEEELRPKKKRKRRIVDPQKGPAVAKPRVSLDGRHPTDTTRAGPSSQAPAPTPALPRSAIFNSEAAREARRQRRVTMDMGILASTSTQPSTSSQVSRPADKQASAGRPSASGLRLPRTNLADGVTPLQRAQARRKSTNLTGRPDGESSGAGPSRPRAPPSTAPAPAEIIEILDSDDEPPPPTQPAAVPKAPAPPPRPNIPRRTKYKTVPVPRYREDNGIIILDDDDDDPPPPPPATQSINHAKPTAPTSNTPLARDPSPVRQVPLRQSPSTSATRRPQTPVSAAVHAEVVSEPIAPEPDVQDIEMAEEEPPGPDMDTGFIPPEEPTVIDEQPIDSVATSEVNAEPDEPPDGDIAMDDTSVPPDLEVDLVQNPADITARSPSLPPVPPADEAPSEPLPASEGRSEEADEAVRDSPLLPRVAPSSSEDVTPSSVPPEPLLASVFFQPKPKDNATDLPPQSPQPQSQPALPASVLPSGPREGTESPVSAMLDPPLKDLSISDISPTSPQTGTPPPASPQPPVPTAKSPTPATAKSLPPSTAKLPSPATSNPSTPQRPKLPRVKIKGFLYGGPDGFFAPVHRLSQKRLSQASPLPQGSNVGASTSKAGSRASASLSPTASRVARAVKPPVSSSQDTRERSSSSTAPGGNLIETLPLDAAEKPRTEASEMLEVQSAAAVEAEVSMSRPKSPAKEAAPQVIAAADAPLVGRQEDHPMEDNVKETQEPAPGLEAHIPPGEVSAESLTGTSAAVPNSALESASAARAPTQVVSAEEEAQVSVSSVQAEAEEASGAERSDTPPPTEEQPQSRTLSQIIRKAVNEIAKNEIIDLTCDDSDNEPTTHTGPSTSKPTEQGMTVNVPLTPTSGPPSTSTDPPVTPAPASQAKPIRTLDLSAFNRNTRKQPRASLGNQLSPTKPGSSSSPLPLPRNLGRGASAAKPPLNSLSITQSPPVRRQAGLHPAKPSEGLASASLASPASPPTHPVPAQPLVSPALAPAAASAASEPHASPTPAHAHVTPVLPQGSGASPAPYSVSNPLLSQGQPKPMLPRLRDIIKASQAARAAKLQASSSPSPQLASPRDADNPDQALSGATSVASRPLSPQLPSPSAVLSTGPPALSDAGSVESVASVPALEGLQAETPPPRSSSPEAIEDEVMEEEECLSLIYPDNTDSTPDVEMLVEQEQESEQTDGVLGGRRTRSQVVSGASSVASGPRRSARLTSNSASASVSASSSVEPPERPKSRARRPQPYVHTASDEEVAAQGGIARRTNFEFMKAFANAGFEAVSWKHDRQRLAAEFAPLTQLAKDIPHDLHDRLNSLSLSARLAGDMQVLIFEAEIRANTADDEPYAPPIHIVNEVDDEPTPPLEFYYSNLMWHGEGVPKPDHDNLQGCDCIGPCDPSSKTCSCVKRQRKYWDGPGGGFIYDKKGKLRAHEYPIFECNMNCACSEDCPNRVVQHGRQHEIAICKTAKKGWGVFAGQKKIPANSFIGIYAGEYLTDSEGETRGTIYNKFGRTYLFDLDFWFLGSDKKVKYCIDAYHAGNFTRYLNHSCDPNCVINACYINEANMDKPLLTIFTCREVEAYEELCFSYFGQPDDEVSEDHLPKKPDDAVYVTCQCGAPNCRGTMWK